MTCMYKNKLQFVRKPTNIRVIILHVRHHQDRCTCMVVDDGPETIGLILYDGHFTIDSGIRV